MAHGDALGRLQLTTTITITTTVTTITSILLFSIGSTRTHCCTHCYELWTDFGEPLGDESVFAPAKLRGSHIQTYTHTTRTHTQGEIDREREGERERQEQSKRKREKAMTEEVEGQEFVRENLS